MLRPTRGLQGTRLDTRPCNIAEGSPFVQWLLISGFPAQSSKPLNPGNLLMRIFRRNLGAIARPLGVERAGLVDALVGVRSEEVALALDDGGGQTIGT